MRELLESIDAWLEDGADVGRAVVVRTFGSAPRPEGAVLATTADGRIAGSVSGGCVEGAAAEEIERARATGRSRVIRYGISDEQAWDVGLACGGTIDVLVEPAIPAEALEAARASASAHPSGAAIVTALPADSPPQQHGAHLQGDGETPGQPLRVDADGALDGTLGSAEADAALVEAALDALRRGTSRTVEIEGRQLFIEAFPVRPRIVIVGATEIARALVSIAADLGYERIVIDARPAFAAPARFPDVERLINDWPDEAFAAIDLGPDDAVAILSHDPKFDEPAIAEAIRRGARYVGAIGSRKTQADRRARLREAGLTDDKIASVHGPIGLDLGGRSSAETALAIMAEIVASRYGATAGAKSATVSSKLTTATAKSTTATAPQPAGG
ncbi:MAG TPA: XdhC family protein [Candidatus Limnocylindrales bacterium]|nr:XdhC family protein [Candidatus Limnocylindrales bacterium]